MSGTGTSLRSLVVAPLRRPGQMIADTEMGSHLIAKRVLNLQNNQGHRSALSQKSQVNEIIVISGKVKVAAKGA